MMIEGKIVSIKTNIIALVIGISMVLAGCAGPSVRGYLRPDVNISQIKFPAKQLMWCDTDYCWGAYYNTIHPTRHNGYTNVLYVDGHVDPVLSKTINYYATWNKWPWNVPQQLKSE